MGLVEGNAEEERGCNGVVREEVAVSSFSSIDY
jgi:hypothetical protein